MTDNSSISTLAPTPAAPVETAAVSVLALTGELSIYQAQELKKTLLDALRPGATLALDLSGVTMLDTSGVQLLLLAQRTAQAQQGNVCITQPSAPVREVLELLRLHTQLISQP